MKYQKMQKYIEEKFLKEHQVIKMDALGWVEKPDLLRLITIEPSHFSNGFEQTIAKIKFGEFSCCYNLVSLDLSSFCNLKEIESVSGGTPVVIALGLWTILVTGKNQLTEIGNEIGAGLYDGLHPPK